MTFIHFMAGSIFVVIRKETSNRIVLRERRNERTFNEFERTSKNIENSKRDGAVSLSQAWGGYEGSSPGYSEHWG